METEEAVVANGVIAKTQAEPIKKVRNNLLDIVKIVVAIGVIFVHFPISGAFGKILGSLGTSGVILFFIISGYAAYKGEDVDNSRSILKRIKRTGLLVLVSVAIYIAYSAIFAAIYGNMDIWISNWSDPRLYPLMIFVGDFDLFGGDALWFLVALFWAYFVFLLFEKKKLRDLATILLPFLLALRIVMETYTNTYPDLSWHWSGNALVGALPAMTLGYVIHIKEASLLKIKGWVLLSLSAISVALMFLTVNFKVFVLDISQIFKISTAALVFLVCLRWKDLVSNNPISTFGAEGSLFVYLFHPLIGSVLSFILIEESIEFYYYAFPWIVVGVSVSFAIVALLVKKLIRLAMAKSKEKKLAQKPSD